MLEAVFQAQVIKDIERRLPDSIVLKLDTEFRQGVPDLLVLDGWFWGTLECKRRNPRPSDYEPNQPWYIEKMDGMSFSICIYPANAEEVLNELQRASESRRHARFSES